MNRRQFLKRSLIGTGGIASIPFLPNIFVPSAYAGISVIVDSSGDKRIALSNAAFARTFDVGTWSVLRIGMRAHWVGTATPLDNNPLFFFGVCSGTTNQIFDATTTNAVGQRLTTTTLNWSATTDPSYDGVGNWTNAIAKKVGTTWTTGGGTFDPVLMASPDLAPFYVTITKGTPDWTLKTMYWDATSFTEITRDQFLTQMVVAGDPAYAGGFAMTNNTIAFDEVAGTVDSVQVGWNKFLTYFEISDIAVAKIAS